MRDIGFLRPVAAALLLAIAGCSRPDAPADDSSQQGAPPEVSQVHPKKQALRLVVEQPGTVQAYEETYLYARVPGYVRRVAFDIGQKIHGPQRGSHDREIQPGDVLAEMDVPELEQGAKQKQAQVQQALAEVEQADKALTAARANLAVAEANITEGQAFHDRWESESRRMAGLVKSGVVDAQAREETENQYRAGKGRLASARASERKAQADRDKAEADVKAAHARVAVARAAAREAEAWLSYGKVRAPYDGKVTLRKVNTGDLVQPAAGKGDFLFAVARTDPVRIVVAVPEADAELVQEKAQVDLRVGSSSRPNLHGTVARTSWALQPGSRTLRTEIDLPNKDDLLRPGMYVHAFITNVLPPTWTLPAAALRQHDGQTICFLLEGDRVVQAAVQSGRTDGKSTQVFRYRKPGGDWVEWTGQEKLADRAAGLSDGQKVERKGQEDRE